MKILHIGKKGNVEKYTKADEFTRQFEIADIPMGLSDEEILKAGGDADFIIADAMGTVSAGVINGMPNLKMIHSEGVGYNFFDVDAAGRKGVYVCNCKGMNAMAVAEQTVLLMLGLLRNVKQGDTDVREGRQIITKENYMKEGNLYELADFKIGLLGFGDIAKCTARLTAAFGAETYFTNTSGADPELEKEYNAKYLPLDELLGKCNMISIHLPVTEKTKHMVNDEFFDKMLDGSYIINTSRGEIIDSEALIKAMERGKIYKAGLDTVEGEPVKCDNVLLTQNKEIEDRILFSPHIGGVTASSFTRGYAMAWENIRRISEGLEPIRVVNREAVKTGISGRVLGEIRTLAKKYDVDKVILFGSRARGDFRRTSDIDLAVSGGDRNRFWLDVEEDTSTLLEYDIVDLNGYCQKELIEEIKKDGVVLYEKV